MQEKVFSRNIPHIPHDFDFENDKLLEKRGLKF